MSGFNHDSTKLFMIQGGDGDVAQEIHATAGQTLLLCRLTWPGFGQAITCGVGHLQANATTDIKPG